MDYHIDWLLGIKQNYNVTYDDIGIWNEMPWIVPDCNDFVIRLRKGLDSQPELKDIKIVIPDGKAQDAINSVMANSTVRDAVFAIDRHGHDPFTFGMAKNIHVLMNEYGFEFWISENNIVDGEHLQYAAVIEWLRVNMQNYL